MATIKSLPTDVIKKIFSFINVRDELAMVEAIPSFESSSEIQLETTTDFRVQEDKRILVVVTSETNCKNSMSAALIYYREVHLVLSRSVVEHSTCDNAYFLRRYLEEVTGDGTAPFTSIEIVGRIPSCGCGFACLTR